MDVFTGKPRRLHWTCRYCGHTFKTYTRRGLRVTCPQCHRVQEGPAGVTRLFDRATKKVEAKPVTTLKIVAVNGQQTKPKPTLKPTAPKAAPKAATPPPAPKKPEGGIGNVIGRALGFEG